LAHEPLAHAVHSDSSIQGLTINNINFKTSLYADDTLAYLSGTSDLLRWSSILQIYNSQSDALVNYSKSFIIFLCNPFSLDHLSDTLSIKTSDRLLGVNIGPSATQSDTLLKFLNSAYKWRSRPWPLFGKAALIKVFCVSKLSFISSFLNIPLSTALTLSQAYDKAIWNKDKATKIKKSLALLPLRAGGINATDLPTWFHTALAKWIPDVTQSNSKWAQLAKSIKISPKKNGSILEKAKYFWQFTNLDSNLPTSCKCIYKALLQTPISQIPSSINAYWNWNHIHNTMV
jgi:hypothetical protein